ncbi:ammonium transporter, partial [Novosphingobium sp. Rr 2-17]|uniref:ammonium transporter n=1 Tax=Novosphingobium sp. Rr 2-17 TaxID=555793 RepID=UPI0002699B76
MAGLNRYTFGSALALMVAIGWPTLATAQDGRLDVADSADTAWLLAASLVALLTVLPGLALFHAGRVRAGNAVSVLLQVGAVAAFASLLWVAAGYTLAFGETSHGFVGKGNAWMLIQLGNVRAGTGVPESAFVLFQMSCAMLAPALMTGAWAGRARFGWVIAFTGLWSLIVYAPLAHWIWGGGWLATSVHALDWSGGLIVHGAAGISALVVALLIGPRRDPGAAAAHSPSLALAGAGLLWVGTLAQSGGFALTATDDASAAIIATHAAIASGALVWLLLDRVTGHRPGALSLALGAVSGLATIAAGAGYVSPGGAIVIGAIGALACRLASGIMRKRIGVDDTLGVFAIHGVGGLLGALLTGLFMAERVGGIGYGGAGGG